MDGEKMRDPARIDRILKFISEIWKEHPDLRLCQLIENSLGSCCLYYCEDDSLEKYLKKFYLRFLNENMYKMQ